MYKGRIGLIDSAGHSLSSETLRLSVTTEIITCEECGHIASTSLMGALFIAECRAAISLQ
jgi:hypothetical protein